MYTSLSLEKIGISGLSIELNSFLKEGTMS